MKSILHLLACFLAFFCRLNAQESLDRPAFTQIKMRNGGYLFIQQNPMPAKHLSLRLVWRDKSDLKIEKLNLLTKEEERLTLFLKQCLKKMPTQVQDLALFIVGDFDTERLGTQIASYFDTLVVTKQNSLLEPLSYAKGSGPHELEIELSYIYSPCTSLREQWVLHLFTHLFENALKTSLSYPVEGRFLAPSNIASVRLKGSSEVCLENLYLLLSTIQHLKKEGFQERDFSKIKHHLIYKLASLNSTNPSHSDLIEYLVQQYLSNGVVANYADFLSQSLHLLPDIKFTEVYSLINSHFLDRFRFVNLKVLPSAGCSLAPFYEALEDFHADEIQTQDFNEEMSPIEEKDLYSELVATMQEKEIIWKIIDTLASNNLLSLGFKKSDLEKKGRQVHHLHPLRFLGTILADPHLRECLKEVRTSSFKWNGFMDGLVPRLELEYHNRRLLQYLPSFCKAMHADVGPVNDFAQEHDWDGMVKFLLKS
jgi:hypothetical protein